MAGATRGCGRGIAAALGEAGATVVCTGRSSRTAALQSDYDRAETIEETAAMVTVLGGTGLARPVDHLDPDQVRDLAGWIPAAPGGTRRRSAPRGSRAITASPTPTAPPRMPRPEGVKGPLPPMNGGKGPFTSNGPGFTPSAAGAAALGQGSGARVPSGAM